jgi:hypothetical protein
VQLFVVLAACAPLHVTAALGGILPNICASMSSASGTSLTLATAGVAQSFTITARDATGIPVASDGGATFAVRLGDQMARSSVQHVAGTGTYVGSYDATTSGIDKLSLMLAECEFEIFCLTCKWLTQCVCVVCVCFCVLCA